MINYPQHVRRHFTLSNIFRIGKATLSSALLKLFAQKYIDKPKGDRQIILAAENFSGQCATTTQCAYLSKQMDVICR